MKAEPVADLGVGHLRLSDASADVVGLAGLTGEEYGPPDGFPALREAVASWEGVSVQEVSITTGASLGLVAALTGLKRPGSILCPCPFYPAYPRLAEMLGFEVIFYGLDRMRGWQPNTRALGSLLRHDTRALLWNFPSNPTGAVPDSAVLAEVREIVRAARLLVLSDEVYADFTYGDTGFPDTRTALGAAQVVRVRSFSKVFGMPGERLGYVIGSPAHLSRITRSHWLLALSPPSLAQTMALAGMRADPARRVRELRHELCGLRELAGDLLTRCHRIRFAVPSAGFFYWIEVPDCPLDSRALARKCAAEAGVLVQPGAAFGVEDPVYLRASFAVGRQEAVRGFKALADFLERL